MVTRTIEEAEQSIRSLGLPVMMLDTCVLLDIIRAPIRNDAASLKAALKLLTRMLAAPASVQLVVTYMVMKEWADNSLLVRDEVLGKVRQLNEQIDVAHEVCAVAGISTGLKSIYDGNAIASQLQQVSTKLLNSAIIVEKDANCSANAYERVVNNVPPARKGGQLKDCDIVEHYLTLSEKLTSSHFVPKRLFVSSNTKDYCQDGRLHSTLQAEFSRVGLAFATNLSWGEATI